MPEGQRWKAKLSERGAKCKAELKTENLAIHFNLIVKDQVISLNFSRATRIQRIAPNLYPLLLYIVYTVSPSWRLKSFKAAVYMLRRGNVTQ